MKNKKYIDYLLYFLIVVISFVFDRITKNLIISNFALLQTKSIINNFFYLTYIQNEGAAFGILSGKVLYLVLFSILVVGFIIYQFYSYKDSKFMCSFFALLLGGLLGNFYDRIVYRYVIDFLDFKLFNYDAPVFNLADTFICVSIFFIIIGIIKYEGGMLYGIKDTSDELRSKSKTGSIPSNETSNKSKPHNKTHKRK